MFGSFLFFTQCISHTVLNVEIPPFPRMIAFALPENVRNIKTCKMLVKCAVDVYQTILKPAPQIKLWKRLCLLFISLDKSKQIVLATFEVERAFDVETKDALPLFQIVGSSLARNVQRTGKRNTSSVLLGQESANLRAP